MGMSSSTLPGRSSMPDDEPPGSDNIRKRNKNRRNTVRIPSFPKKPAFPRKPNTRKKQRRK